MNSLRLSGSALRGDVLGGDHRPLDHQDVELGLQHERGVPLTRWGVSDAHETTPAVLDLADPRFRSARLDRLPVELLHPAGRLLVRAARRSPRRSARGPRSGSADPPGSGTRARRAGRPRSPSAGETPASMRRRHHGQLERVRIDLPADVDVIGVARPPGRNDRDLVEPVGPACRLADADLELHSAPPPRPEEPGNAKRPPGPGWASIAAWAKGSSRSPRRFSSLKPRRAIALPVPGGTDRGPRSCGSRDRSSPDRVRHACRRGPDPLRRHPPTVPRSRSAAA